MKTDDELAKMERAEANKKLHGLSTADCPRCRQESRFRHKHDSPYGLEGAHMAGSERFECAFCDFVVWPNMAADFPTLLFVLDKPTAPEKT